MRTIREAMPGELVWEQPHALRREFELRAGGDVLATLRWQGGRGSLAFAETEGGRWTFKRQGFWRPRATARLADGDAEVASFEASWHGGGTFTVPAGASFRWGSANLWQSRWTWQDLTGAALVTFASRPALTKLSSRVDVAPGAADLPDLPLLVTFGWYLLVLHGDEVAVTTATMVATTG